MSPPRSQGPDLVWINDFGVVGWSDNYLDYYEDSHHLQDGCKTWWMILE